MEFLLRNNNKKDPLTVNQLVGNSVIPKESKLPRVMLNPSNLHENSIKTNLSLRSELGTAHVVPGLAYECHCDCGRLHPPPNTNHSP